MKPIEVSRLLIFQDAVLPKWKKMAEELSFTFGEMTDGLVGFASMDLQSLTTKPTFELTVTCRLVSDESGSK